MFIDGYPGKYVVLARKNGDKWYIAGVNAQKEPVKATLALPMLKAGSEVKLYSDNDALEGNLSTAKINKKGEIKVTIPCNGGLVIVADAD